MLKIAITGNIASGKSAVQKLIEDYGYKVLDTDILAHAILEESPEIKSEFIAFDVFDINGKISRQKLGKLVFSDERLKQNLEKIMHPKIGEKMADFFEKNIDEKFVFVGIPLLFETGMQDMFDKIILVYTDDSIREKRLTARNHYSLEYAKIRMNCQGSQEEKKKLSDFVIYNNGSFDDLKSSVENLLSILSK